MEHKSKAVREPLIRLSRRDVIPLYQAILIRAAAILLALLLGAIFIYSISGLNPLSVYQSMFEGTFKTTRRMWDALKDTAILLMIGIALAPAFKMRFWNIGAEGQVLFGCLASAAVMIYGGERFGVNLPSGVVILLCLIASVVAGALWGVIPALFKAKWKTNETLFTLMMNYIAIQLAAYAVSVWEYPYGSNSVGVINSGSHIGWLPTLFGQNYGFDVLIAVLCMVLMYVYLRYTKHGYEISVVGESENTARYAGISIRKVFLRTMLISGAVCGLAGFMIVNGTSHTVSSAVVDNRGFTAIIVAWLAKFNTFIMAAIAFLLVFLDKGASQIATDCQLNTHASEIVSGIILFFIIGCEFFVQYKVSVSLPFLKKKN